jgi:hypothetical protein
MRDQFEWVVAGLVVLGAGLAALGAAAFLAVPMVAYSWTWWKLALGL